MTTLKRFLFELIAKIMFLLRLLLPFKKKLLIIYDLAVNGVGFDFYIFMENALQLKKKVGLLNFDLCIVSSETENNGLIFKKNQYFKEKKKVMKTAI